MPRILVFAVFVILSLPVPGRAAVLVSTAEKPVAQMSGTADTLTRACARDLLAKLAAACAFTGIPGAEAADGPALPAPAEFACRPHLSGSAALAPPCGASPPERPPRQTA
jgi:hypothetical protein